MLHKDRSLEDLCTLYTDVFSGMTEQIPLIITPECDPGPSREDLVIRTEDAVREKAESFTPKVEANTDWLPNVCIAWYQMISVPSAFGAETMPVDEAFPVVKPLFNTIDEAVDAGIPSVETPIVDEMLSVLDKALSALPEGFFLSFPASVSPIDLAQLLLPGDTFFVSLIYEEEKSREFLDNLTVLFIKVQKLVNKRLAGTISEFVTCRGAYFPGLRFPVDAIVNLSPNLIEAYVLPMCEQIGNEFGSLCIHFCTAPAPSGHVLPVLTGSEHIKAVDNWQGPEVFIGEDAPARFQDKISLFTDVDLSTPDKMDAFLNREPVKEVARKNGRGLVVHTNASSVDEAKRIYGEWQARMEKS